MSPTNVNLEEKEAGQRLGIRQKKLASGGDFWLLPSPGGGDFWISSDHRCHLGLEAVKYLDTSRLPAALPWGFVTKRWPPLFPQGSVLPAFFIHSAQSRRMDKVSIFYSLYIYSHEYIHSSDDPQKNWFLQNENLKGYEKQNSATGFTDIKFTIKWWKWKTTCNTVLMVCSI